MNDSRNRTRRVLGALAALALLCAGVPAFAQDADSDAPIRLIPLDEIEPPAEAPAVPDIPNAPEAPPEAAVDEAPLALEVDTLAPPEETAPAGDAVEVGRLGEINADDVGLLSEASGAYPASLWRGARYDMLTLLLPRLPIAARSPAMRTAILKLRRAPGAAPRRAVAPPGDLLRARAELLARMGEYNVAIGLLRAAPAGDFSATIARYESDYALLRLDFAAACEQARARLDESPDAYWQRALVFCQSKDGEAEAATLGLDLLRETGHAPDPAFVRLIDAMNGYGEKTLDSLPNPTPMLVAMLRLLEISAPMDALEVANPALLRLIASAANGDIALRIAAAERAEAVGALPAESVGALYNTVPFDDAARANPIAHSAEVDGPLARAILYQAILAEEVPTARAEAIGLALERAREEGRFATMARVLLPAIQALPASREFAWFAAEAGRAYFAANRWEEARRWYDLALAERAGDAEALRAAVTLWPLMALTDGEGAVDPGMLEAWWEAAGGALDPVAHQRGGLLLTLFAALGRDIRPEQWDDLLAGPLTEPSAVSSPALRQALAAAAADGRLGETVLLALLGLGAGGPQNAGLVTLEQTIAGLRTVALDQDARALAVEAALAGGL
jgi:plasmid stability protein